MPDLKRNRGTVLYANISGLSVDKYPISVTLPVFNEGITKIDNDGVHTKDGIRAVESYFGNLDTEFPIEVKLTISYPDGDSKISMPFKWSRTRRIDWCEDVLDEDLSEAGSHAIIIEGLDGVLKAACDSGTTTPCTHQ